MYDTAPRNSLDQPHFLNAALELETDRSPLELLGELKRLELRIGRDPNAPRRGGPSEVCGLIKYGTTHPVIVDPRRTM